MRVAFFALSLALFTVATGCHDHAAPGPFGIRYSAVAGSRLYVLDEAGSRVVRLDPKGAATGSAIVGPAPQSLAATADGAWVVTLSPSTGSLWAVRTAPSGDLAASNVALRPHHNAFAMTGSGARYAVTFVDLSAEGNLVVDGTASFNEITVVDLNGTTPVATPVVVGFNPRQVVFTPDGQNAIVLSQSFASIVPLATPAAIVRVPLGADTAANPVTPETAIATNDGTTAIVARSGSTDVFVITLSPPSVNIIDFGIAPSRFVSSADGATVLALRAGSSSVSLLDLATGVVHRVEVGGPVSDAVVPSDPSDRRALLWGNGFGREEIYRVDLDLASAATLALVNPAVDVSIGPDGTAVVLHVRQPTPGGDEVQRFFDEHEALSILDKSMRLVTPIALDARPGSVVFASDALGNPRAIVPLEDSAHVAEIDLGQELATAVRVAAAPVAARAMATGASAPVAILHDQPFGLVTFLDPDGVTTHVVSGFLLDGKI